MGLTAVGTSCTTTRPLLSTTEGQAGYRRLALDPAEVSRLLEPVADLTFTHITSARYGVSLEARVLTSPFDLASAPATQLLSDVAVAADWIGAAEAVAGTSVRFTSATYLAYAPGSFIGCHTDRKGCDVNLLLLLGGPPTHAEIFPDLHDAPMRMLYERSRAHSGVLPDPVTVRLDRGQGVGFKSSETPHQRSHVQDAILLVSFCYAISGAAP